MKNDYQDLITRKISIKDIRDFEEDVYQFVTNKKNSVKQKAELVKRISNFMGVSVANATDEEIVNHYLARFVDEGVEELSGETKLFVNAAQMSKHINEFQMGLGSLFLKFGKKNYTQMYDQAKIDLDLSPNDPDAIFFSKAREMKENFIPSREAGFNGARDIIAEGYKLKNIIANVGMFAGLGTNPEYNKDNSQIYAYQTKDHWCINFHANKKKVQLNDIEELKKSLEKAGLKEFDLSFDGDRESFVLMIPKKHNSISESKEGDEDHVEFPSLFGIGERVDVAFGIDVLTETYVRAVIFTNAKVRYSIFLNTVQTTIHNVDSVFVFKHQSIEGDTAPDSIKFDFDNYS